MNDKIDKVPPSQIINISQNLGITNAIIYYKIKTNIGISQARKKVFSLLGIEIT